MDKAEQWRKDGWNHDPVLLADIMSKYAEIHDGSGGLDMEMIDDVLMIAALDKDNAEEIESLRSELQKQKEEIQRFELERTEMYDKYEKLEKSLNTYHEQRLEAWRELEKQKELNAELVKEFTALADFLAEEGYQAIPDAMKGIIIKKSKPA